MSNLRKRLANNLNKRAKINEEIIIDFAVETLLDVFLGEEPPPTGTTPYNWDHGENLNLSKEIREDLKKINIIKIIKEAISNSYDHASQNGDI